MGRHDNLLQEGQPGHTVTSHEVRLAQLKTRNAFEQGMALREVAVFEAKKMVRLTRKMVVEGLKHRRAFHAPIIGEGVVLIIRPISDMEYGQVQDMLLEQFDYRQLQNLGKPKESGDDSPDVDLTEVRLLERKAKYQVLAFALSCDGEDFTAEEVGALPTGIVDPLYEHVAMISGFRPASRGGSAG